MNTHSSRSIRAHSLRLGFWAFVLVAVNVSAQERHGDHGDAHGSDFAQHGVHEHGKLTFNVALEGQQLVVELDAPAENVLGFEHAPRTDAEKTKVRDRAAWLRSGAGLIALPPAAACRFHSAKLEAPQWQEGKSHADYEVELSYRCDQPLKLAWLQLSLLGGLQGVREARVNLVTPVRQASETVTSAETRVRLQ
jgi:uncharacterized protein DUF2796